MEKNYHFATIEKQAQQDWADNDRFKVTEDPNKEKFYCLCMFPYPSGKLHIGHVRNYTLGDIISRYQRMQGKNVLQPMGWDAFGLPAEGAAIKNNMPPAQWTYDNIAYMKQQLKTLGFGYDWSREIATCDPSYYHWEQWFFTRLYEKGLVYKKLSEVNWDPVDQTVLANEQVIDGRGWRSGALVEKKEIPQWFIKITDYADELLHSLDNADLEWPEKVKIMQRNWIGQSVGLEVDFAVADRTETLRVFTTRPDTLYGVTYMAIAYNHPLAKAQCEQDPTLAEFCRKISQTSTAEADMETMEKLGMATGLYATHPLTQEKIPIMVANFVLMSYGTGAVMAVPAHDQRDFEFAQKYQLPINPVIQAPADFDWQSAYTHVGTTINSGEFSGLDFDTAFARIADTLISKGLASKKTNYRLRDWGVSRQRYWGAPIPFYLNQAGDTEPVPDSDLPVRLPESVTVSASGSPLKHMPEFLHTTNSATGEAVTRETDTFDTFMESSWYYARYTCPDNHHAMLDERANYWLPVDQYIGGIEHAILHLLYARFFHKLLRDEGLVSSDEPFKNLLTQGMVVAPTYYRDNSDGSKTYFNPDNLDIQHDSKGKATAAICKTDGLPVTIGKTEKMSKSKNNGADPQQLIEQYGADTVRLFIAFAAPPEQSLEWSDSGVEGAHKFLKKVWHYAEKHQTHIQSAQSAFPLAQYGNTKLQNARRLIHQTLQQANADFEKQQFNTVVSACMKIYNAVSDLDGTDNESNTLRCEAYHILLRLLAPITPHIAHALWPALGFNGDILDTPWPQVDDSALVQSEIEFVVQVNGKMRGKIHASVDAARETIEDLAITNENVQKFIADQTIVKVIVVPKKLVNIVVKANP
ncbi:leucine--tRNA ligase [Ostreibacterium oceani]|uniref:Leucine--tRNA ligase n=1 Tax=Ostreibacterium oceani TaxID=2654998 RepID=A0A6N7EVU5_9GAMM|nr:leucine--tRNA ligase [Ostreibacterium oceani]MPV85207.1 leucine--tRNA ligase [Ostreibacterium oceani]